MLAVTMAVTAKAIILKTLALQFVAGIISETLAHQTEKPRVSPGVFSCPPLARTARANLLMPAAR